MLLSLSIVSARLLQIVTLIPVMGMLAWFVHMVSSDLNSAVSPAILVLFIATVIALAWAVVTLFTYHGAGGGGPGDRQRFIALVDLLLLGALIAGVWYLRDIRGANCASLAAAPTLELAGFGGASPKVSLNRQCAMLKASWALGILNCVLFFLTALAIFKYGDNLSDRQSRRRRSSTSRRRVYV